MYSLSRRWKLRRLAPMNEVGPWTSGSGLLCHGRASRLPILAVGRDLVDLGDQGEVALGQSANVVRGRFDPDRAIVHDQVRVMIALLDQARDEVHEFHGSAERGKLPGPYQ